MSILSQFQNLEPGLLHPIHRFFQDDRLYRYLDVYPPNGSCEGKFLHSNHRAEHVPPIHWLPVELLAEIFRHYLQIEDRSQVAFSLSVQRHSQTTPFLLGQVCYYWRSITISMGELWQSLCIDPPRMEHIPSIQLWLSRAGNYPLSLWFFQSRYPSDLELQATNEILSLFVQRLNRWKSIVFRISASVPQALMNLPHGAAVSLEAARIDVRHWDRVSADNLWQALHSSPTISRADWVNLYWDAPPNHAPWTQLTHVTLEGSISVDVVLNILPQCQSIISLALPHLVSSRASSPTSPFRLPELRSLRVSAEADLGSLFQCLILPSLASLDISYRLHAGASLSSVPLADLICRSQCRLSNLTLCDDTNATEDVLADYLCTPALESVIELRLDNQVTDKIVILLSHKERKEQVMPRLRAISLSCCTSDGVFSAMVASRLPVLRTICVTLRGDNDSYRRDRATLGKLREEGYDIEIGVL